MSLANARGMRRWLFMTLALACAARPLPAGAPPDAPPDPGLPACPEHAVAEGEACAMAGLHCEYTLEDACNCVGPELRWACSIGEACDKMSQGMPCYANAPSVLIGCRLADCQGPCYCMNDHWKCDGACP